MSNTSKVSDLIKKLNEKIKDQQQGNKKPPIKKITKDQLNKKQNFEDILKDYKLNYTSISKEEEEILKGLENTYYYYKEKKKYFQRFRRLYKIIFF